MPQRGSLHHVEVWVEDLAGARASWGWLLTALGHHRQDRWAQGESWRLGDAYLVLEAGPDVRPGGHDRRWPGVNHLALWAGTPQEVEALVVAAPAHGWSLLFADRHPHAGGPGHHAAYLEDAAGFEVELVADTAAAG